MASVKRPTWAQDKNANKPVTPKGVTVGVNQAMAKAAATEPKPDDKRKKLDKTTQSAIDRIAADPALSRDEKLRRVGDIINISEGDNAPSFLGGLFGAVKRNVIEPVVRSPLYTWREYEKRVAQPLNNLLASTVNQAENVIVSGVGKAVQKTGIKGKAADLVAIGAQQLGMGSWWSNVLPKWKGEALTNPEVAKNYTPSFSDFLKNADRKGAYYAPLYEEEKYANVPQARKLFATVATQATADPTTYMGVGAVANTGRAGRTALAIRLAERYGPEAVDLNKVIRYGTVAVPKSIRQAENLSTGIRFGGDIIPMTETIGGGIARGVGEVRATIGDVLLNPNRNSMFGRAVTETASKLVPKSQKQLTAIGAGRRAATSSEDIYRNLVKYTMAKTEKGVHATTQQMLRSEILGFNDRVRELSGRGVRGRLPGAVYDPEAANLYRYVEMPESQLAYMPITDELKQLARDVKAFQDRVRTDINIGARELGDDFALNVKEVGYLDDYIHHTLTPEAREWILSENGRRAVLRGDFRGVDMQVQDLLDPTSPMMFRRLRGEVVDPATGAVVAEKFFGKNVTNGTIEEINRIFRETTGNNFDWFKTDTISILDSYSFSMARAKARQAAVRRAFDFGPEVIQPMIKSVVPDPELVQQLTGIVERLRRQATTLRERVGRNVILAGDYAKSGLKYAEDFLNSQQRAVRLNARELAKFRQKLDDEIIRLTEASARAQTKTAGMRGEFEAVTRGIRDEIANLRAALDNPDRYVAGEQLRRIYLSMYPNHNPATLANKTPEWFAEKILNGRGVPASREIRTINKRMKDLREIIDAIPDGVEYTAIRQELESAFYNMELVERGFTNLAESRALATYSDTGLVYGHVDDLIPLPEGVEPFKVFRTTPVDASTFDQSANSVALRAIPESELIDLRNPLDYADFFRPEEFGEHLATALRLKGMQEIGDAFLDQFTVRAAGGAFDPQFEQVYPEVAELIDTIMFHAQIDAGEQVADVTIFEAFEAIDERLRNIIDFPDPEDVDIFAKEVMDDVWGATVARSSAKGRQGLVLPQALVDDLDLADFPDQYAVLVSPEFSAPKPSASTAGDVLSVRDSDLVRSVREGRYEEDALEATVAKRRAEEEIVQLETQQLFATEAKSELSGLGKRKGGLSKAQNERMRKATEAYERFKATDSVEMTIAGEKRVVTREQAQKQLVQMEATVQKELNKLDRQIEAIYRSERLPRIGSEGSGATIPMVTYADRVAMLMNEATVLKAWSDEVGVVLSRDIQDLRTLLSARPPKGAAAGEAAGWVRRIDRTLDAIGQIQDPVVQRAYERVTTLLHADEAQLALLEGVSIPNIERQLDLMNRGLVGRMVDDTLEGWEALTGLGVQMPEEMLSLWKPNLEKLRNAADRNLFLRAYDQSVRFFKTYATSTVGFFVRNGMSATFMNWVAGVDGQATIDGFRAARAIGKGPDAWSAFLSKLSPRDADLYQQAWRAAEATGRGSMDELSSVSTRGILKGRGTDNAYTRFYRRKNELVERAVRMPMALDSLRKGQTFDEAVARVTRYHFDYSDLSEFDEMARKFIPFWIWTSRNVPLQLVERLARPAAYSVYNRISESSPVDDQIVMPNWLSDLGPIGVGGVNSEGGQWIVTPDLPMIRLDNQIEQLTNPAKIIGQFSPILKLPFELAAGKQMGIDVGPFKDRPQPVQGFDRRILYPLAKFFGGDAWLGVDQETGEVLLDERLPYIAQNAFPVLAQMNRITGGATGGKLSYQERQLGNIFNWMGVPFRYVGPQQQESEAFGRTMNITEFLSELQERGLLTEKDRLPEPEKPEELRRTTPLTKAEVERRRKFRESQK